MIQRAQLELNLLEQKPQDAAGAAGQRSLHRDCDDSGFDDQVELNQSTRTIAVPGRVENGVVRPLDPNVRLPERARVIIVAADDRK